jgi:hypothetical protein
MVLRVVARHQDNPSILLSAGLRAGEQRITDFIRDHNPMSSLTTSTLMSVKGGLRSMMVVIRQMR